MTQTDTQPSHDATGELEHLRAQLAQRDQAIAHHAAELAQLRTRHALEMQLRDAGTVDAEAAIALAERAISAKPNATETEIRAAVADLQRMRPWLFRSTGSSPPGATGVQSAATDDAAARRAERLQDAATDASTSGNRMDLLRYLRLRRKR